MVRKLSKICLSSVWKMSGRCLVGAREGSRMSVEIFGRHLLMVCKMCPELFPLRSENIRNTEHFGHNFLTLHFILKF